MQEIKAIIFDLGGVILNINYELTEKSFVRLGIEHFPELYSQHHSGQLFNGFETGKISATDFLQAVKKESSKPLNDQEIIKAWNAMLLDFPADRLTLLRKLKYQYKLFLLSNTNAIHLEAFQLMLKQQHGLDSLDPLFLKTYYSHLIGLRKPDIAAFKQVIDENNLNPDTTLFIDDTDVNILGAAKTGLKTLLLKPPQTIMGIF